MINFLNFKDIFPELIENKHVKLAFLLNLIDPKCGGVLILGKRGVGKSLALKLFKKYLKVSNLPYIEIPLNVTEESLTGGVDVEKTLERGIRVYEKGLLEKAKGGYLLIEEINLLPSEYLSLVFEKSSDYTIVATLNLEEGVISPHFLDKIGMCVVMEELDKKELCVELLKFWTKEISLEDVFLDGYFNLHKHLEIIKGWVSNLNYNHKVLDYAVEITLKNKAFSHRSESFLFFAARAYAALKGDAIIEKRHIDEVYPLVLLHRSKNVEEQPKSKELHNNSSELEEPWDSQNNSQKEKQDLESNKKENFSEDGTGDSDKSDEGSEDLNMFLPSTSKEQVFDLGDVFRPKRFVLKKDRIARNIGGRRTKSKTFLKGGRFIRSILNSKDKDIDVYGTIKAAAPFQKIRGRKERVVIYEEDLRYKEKERKISHLVIFLVDGSGSMAAQRRMEATKGAIFSLLMDCYQKRDKVAMVLFRKSSAETILPPTSSIELAYKRLKELPTGGNTPLSLGLLEAYHLIKKHHIKAPQDRILLVLLSDGRSNTSIESEKDPLNEVKNICYEIKRVSCVDSLVIDTEIKKDFLRLDLARDIANWLSALYFPLENIKSENILSIINFSKEFLHKMEN